MKTWKNFVALIAIMLVSFSAFAADARVFVTMSGEGFQVFKSSLEKMEKLQKEQGVEFFDTKVLAEAACAFGEQNHAALVRKYGTAEKCQGIFLARNNLGSTITLDSFRAQGQGVGFWLADISTGSVVAETPKVSAPAPEAKVAVAAPQENTALNTLTTGLASLKKRFDALYEKGNEPMTKKDVEVILSVQEKELATRNEIIESRFEALEKKVEATDAKANATDAKVGSLDKRVTGIEKSPIVAWGNVVLGVLLTMAFVLCVMAVVVFRKGKAPAPQRGAVPHIVSPSVTDAQERRAA